MIKTLTKVGNSHAILLDKATLQLVGLNENDKVDLRIDGDSIILTRVGATASDEAFDRAADEVLSKRSDLLKRLA